MEKLVALVSEKAGIDAAKAQTAVTTVLSFLKDRLPAPVAGQLDQVVNKAGEGEGEGGGGLGDITKGLGGMFGG